MSSSSQRALDPKGLLAAILAYSAWGFFPMYWQLLKRVSSLETLSHRVLWSLCFYTVIAIFQKKLSLFPSHFSDPKVRRPLAIAAFFIAFNWLLFLWAVTHGHVMESSLGYFICPLLNVAIGAFIFKETMSRLQKISLGFAVAGVLWLTLDFGRPPWIALGLALSFSIYGYIKKTVQGEATILSIVETSLLAPIALLGAVLMRLSSSTNLLPSMIASPASLSNMEWILMVGGGAITGIPLLLFGTAAQRLPLSVLGFFQYLAPSFQFLTAVIFFHEALDSSRIFGFGLIWIALGIFVLHLKAASKARKV